MSIKTSKRIALGVIASLVFAPFAAIAPASAASSAPVITDTADIVVIGETATTTMGFTTAANDETATLSMVVPNGSARTLTNADGAGTDIFAATDGDSTFNATTGVITDADTTNNSTGTLTLRPDVPGRYVITLTTDGPATDTYTVVALPSTAETTSLSVVQTAAAGLAAVPNVIAVVRNAGSLATDGQILAQATVTADSTDLALATVFGATAGTPAGEEITVGGTTLTPSFTIDRTNLAPGSYTMRFWVDTNSNGAYDVGEVFTTATFTVTAPAGPAFNTALNSASNYELATRVNGATKVGLGGAVCFVDTTSTTLLERVNYVEYVHSSLTSASYAVGFRNPVATGFVANGVTLRMSISGPAIWATGQLLNATQGGGVQGVLSNSLRTVDFTGAQADALVNNGQIHITTTGPGKVTISITEIVTATGVTRSGGSLVLDGVTECTAGVYAAAESGVRVQTNALALTAKPIADVTGASTVARNGSGFIAVYIADVNGDLLTDPALSVVATSAQAVTLGWGGFGTTNRATATGAAAANAVLHVRAATTGTILSAPIEISVNGTVLATKTISFTGAPDSIAISAKKISIPTGAATDDAFKYAIRDSAGNRIAFGATVFAVDGTYVTAATPAAGSATAASGVTVTCSTLRGTGSVTLAWGLLGDKREVVQVVCAGGIASFEVTTSKSSYGRAEIGVLTISAKDLAGNPVPDGTALATAAGRIQFTGSGATLAKSPAATDTFTDGKIDYAFTTSATAGSYNFALWHGDLSPAVTKIAAFAVTAPPAPEVAPTYTKPTLKASLVSGRVLLFGACEADEGDMVVFVKSPGKAWQERAKTLECVAGEYEGSLKAPKAAKYYRVKQEGTGLWSGSGLIRP